MILAAAALALVGCEELSPPSRSDAGGVRDTVPAFGMMAWRANQLKAPDFALIRRSGATYYRFNLLTSSTDDLEPRSTRGFDRLIAAGVSQGIEFLPVLLRSRPNRDPEGPPQLAEPPETAREHAIWRERVRFYAERYGPEGRFWSENPRLPYRPILAWEVWNEPNLPQFWDDREADPREYARLLRETRSVLRSVDPGARIVSAGLSSRYDAASFLNATLAEVGACGVDAIGIHPYAPSVARAMGHLADARRVADARGADGAPLWITEIGWRVGSRSYSGVPDARAQARRYRGFLAELERRRAELSLGPSFAFSLRDRLSPETGRVDIATGLLGAGDRPRPAWELWSRTASSAPELKLPEARSCAR